MVKSNLEKEEKSIEVSTAEAQHRIQCVEIRLLSSNLHPLDPEGKREGESHFTFGIRVDVRDEVAYSQLRTHVVFVSSKAGAPLRGYSLNFTLMGVFTGDEETKAEILGDFARLYTLSILWPYAREYTSDQFQRAGESFDALPIINPQFLTESMIESGAVEVAIHEDEHGAE